MKSKMVRKPKSPAVAFDSRALSGASFDSGNAVRYYIKEISLTDRTFVYDVVARGID